MSIDTDQYSQILINCMAACSVIYEENPCKALSSCNFNHEIEKVIMSKDIDGSLDIKYMICYCSTSETNKQMLIAFCETKYMTDFIFDIQQYGEINGCDGGFHSSINLWSLQIPIDFLVNKIIDENFKITFTGYSLGASIASIVAVRLLFHEKTKNKTDNIFFIGFGSPRFVSNEFKSFIDDNRELRERFHFYINERDPIFQLLDDLMDHLYLHQNLYSEPNVISNLKSFMEEFLSRTLNIKRHVGVFANLNFKTDKIDNMQSFELFGSRYQSNGEAIYYSEDILKSRKNKFESNQSDIKSFFSLINMSKCESVTMNKRKKIEKINDVTDQLFLPPITLDLCKEKFVVNEFETDIFLNISCKNKEFISKIYIELFNQELIKKNTICNSDSISFIFSCPNHFLTGSQAFESLARTDGFIIYDDPIFECILTSHFNQVDFTFNTHNKDSFEIGFNKKQETIENMDLDLLYLSAVFYANIFKNAESLKLRDRCNEMFRILSDIDKIWGEDLSKTKNYIYNEKKGKAMLFERIGNHLVNPSYMNSIDKEKESFKDKFVNLNEYTNIDEWSTGKINGYDEQSRFKKLLLDIMPTCYELAKKQTISYSINNIIKFYKTEKWFTSLIGSVFFPIAYPIIFFSSSSYFDKLESYTFSITNLSNNKIKLPSLKYCGCYETSIINAINAGTYKDDKTDKVLQTIKLNRKIRDLFAADYQFGVIGKKKLGKSTFVQTVLPDAKVKDADANIGTIELTPYIITDLVTLNDYPHFDSTNLSHKIQFMFTRFLLDHIFFVCDSKERMESEGTMDIFDLIKNGCGDHFTILLNRIDDSLKDCSTHPDFGYKILIELKREVLLGSRDGRLGIGEQYSKNMMFTYLERVTNGQVNLDQLDRMENLNALEYEDRNKRLTDPSYSEIKERLQKSDQINQLKDLIGDDLIKNVNNDNQKNCESSTNMLRILFMLKIMKDLNLINYKDIMETYKILLKLETYVMLIRSIFITKKSDIENLEKTLTELKALNIINKFKELELVIHEKISNLEEYKTEYDNYHNLGTTEKIIKTLAQ